MALKELSESGRDIATDGRRDVQTTTFSVDGIARYVCNTWEEALAAQNGAAPFDAVIVGSGMYGAYLASKLWEFGGELGEGAPRVLVLEAGPFLVGEHVQNLARLWPLDALVNRPLVGPPGQSRFVEPPTYRGANGFSLHARCVGGKSLFWGGWSPRLIEGDLRRSGSPWPAEAVDCLFQPGVAVDDADDGYPIVELEIGARPETDFIHGALYDTLFDRARDIAGTVHLGAGNETRLSEPLPPPIAVQAEAPQSGLFSFDKYSSLPLLIDALRRDIDASGGQDARRRLLLVPNANVLRLVTENGLVTGIDVALIDRTATGVPQEPSAPEVVRSVERLPLRPGASVVLAANTIESTRIALNSFRRPAALGPELMGRNLMCHVRSNHVWQVKREALGLASGVRLGNTALHVPGTSRALHGAGRPGHFHFQFYASANLPTGSTEGALDPEQYLYRLLPNFDEVQDIREGQDPDTIAFGIRTCGETFGDRTTPIPQPADVPQAEAISWMDTPPPGTADEVFRDAYGQELARVPWAFVQLVETPDDRAVREDQTAAAFGFVAALAGVPVEQTGRRFASKQAFLQADDLVRYITASEAEQDGIGSTYHECGTLWMGDDPARSVTDVHGRFHHVSNAYATDQALFPTSGSANPVPTGLALVRKIARGITSRHRSRPAPILEPGFAQLYDGGQGDWSVAGTGNFFEPAPAGEPPLLSAGVESDAPALGVFWYRVREFADFELRLQWRIFSPIANGGVFLRAPEPTGDLFAAGGFHSTALEIQIDERGFDPATETYGSPPHRTGALYGRLPANRWAAKAASPRDGRQGYWNDLAIRLAGDAVTVRLNDELVCSGATGRARASGFLGLQCHTEVVQYRSIRLQEL